MSEQSSEKINEGFVRLESIIKSYFKSNSSFKLIL